MTHINIEFGEISLEMTQLLLDTYRKAKAGEQPTASVDPAPAITEVPKLAPKTMREEVAMFSERHGKDAVRELFSKLGVQKLGELPVDRYPELRTLLDQAEQAA